MLYRNYLKRFFDVFGALFGMLVLGVIFPFVAVSIKKEDGGPTFYNAERLGKDGRIFNMYKFRTMKVNAPDLRLKDGSTYNSDDDPRVTKIGRFLRKTSIDEIPQIINVLKGQMSFIGPRPDPIESVTLYQGCEARKLEVRPGISGYSQAFFRNSIEWKQRIQNDIYYIDHLSFSSDIKILAATISMVIRRQGVHIDKKMQKQIHSENKKDDK